MRLSREEIEEAGRELAFASPEGVISWAVGKFRDRVALASSFGAEDVAVLHMLRDVTENPRIFMLDTGRLHEETYRLVDEIREKYGVVVEVITPRHDLLQPMILEHGPGMFYRSVELRHMCCDVRKVEPLNRALSGLDAWITGLRRSQAVTRSGLGKIEYDASHGGIVKINPLADFLEKDVWDFIRANGIPFNKLHEKGYPSIGCAPCTRPVEPGEDVRAGRWWWETPETKECGLHLDRSVAKTA